MSAAARRGRLVTGLPRRVLRRLRAALPPRLQLALTRTVLATRRSVRARTLRGHPRGLLAVPGGPRGAAPALICALGVDDAGLAAAAAHARRLRAAGTPALIVTDCDAFGEVRRHDLPFEYVPAAEDIAAVFGDEAAYPAFLERRAARIVVTWRPATLLAVGPTAAPAAFRALPAVDADAGAA